MKLRALEIWEVCRQIQPHENQIREVILSEATLQRLSGDFFCLCQNAVNGKNGFHRCCTICFEASRSSYGFETTSVDVARFPLSIGLLRCP
jgi:hypothetical protein